MSMEEVRWKAVFPGIEVTSSILQCKFPPSSAKSVHPSVNLPGGDGGSGRLPGAAFWPRRHFKLRADDPTTALRVLRIRSRSLKPRAVARGRLRFNPHAYSRLISAGV